MVDSEAMQLLRTMTAMNPRRPGSPRGAGTGDLRVAADGTPAKHVAEGSVRNWWLPGGLARGRGAGVTDNSSEQALSPPLHRTWGDTRGPTADSGPRSHRRGRPLRSGPRRRLLQFRLADDPGRAQTLFPRPRPLRDRRGAIVEADRHLAQTLGRRPTIADIALELALTEEEIIEGLDARHAYRATSLSTPIGDEALELGDTLGTDERGYDRVEAQQALKPALAHLPEREQHIISMRFYGNMTQSQIADRIGVSQMHISRLILHALGELRRDLGADAAMA